MPPRPLPRCAHCHIRRAELATPLQRVLPGTMPLALALNFRCIRKPPISPPSNYAPLFACNLTTELSGHAPAAFRTGPRTHTCAHGAATMITGPLQRVVRCHGRMRNSERWNLYSFLDCPAISTVTVAEISKHSDSFPEITIDPSHSRRLQSIETP